MSPVIQTVREDAVRGCHEVNGTPARMASTMITKLHTQAATQIPMYGQEWKKPPPKKKIDVIE